MASAAAGDIEMGSTSGASSTSTGGPSASTILEVGSTSGAQSTQEIERLCPYLYQAALKGDWVEAKEIIDKDKTNTILTLEVGYGGYTALHVAAGAKHVHFVKEFVKMLASQSNPEYLNNVLKTRDKLGNTAFSLSVAAGSIEITKLLIRHQPDLQGLPGGEGRTPLFIATLFGHHKMASCLYSQPAAPESQPANLEYEPVALESQQTNPESQLVGRGGTTLRLPLSQDRDRGRFWREMFELESRQGGFQFLVPPLLVAPESQPTVLASQPVALESQPANQESEPAAPESQPTNTESQLVTPESQLTVIASQPVNPESQPVAPESQPIVLASQSVAPESEPANPESEPAALESQPANPESQPVILESEPIVLASQPVALESQSANPEFEHAAPEEDFIGVFFNCINTGLYALASKLLRKHPHFASARTDDDSKKTALHILAEKPSAFTFRPPGRCLRLDRWFALKVVTNYYVQHTSEIDGSITILQLLAKSASINPLSLWRRINRSLAMTYLQKYPELLLDHYEDNLTEAFNQLRANQEHSMSRNSRTSGSETEAHALVRALWDNVKVHTKFKHLITTPTHILFDGVKSGNSEFVLMLLRDYHPLLWEEDSQTQLNIIHAAVEHRNASICKSINEVGFSKNLIVTLTDNENNTMLHVAAKLAPSCQLSERAGAAFQMQNELKWFEEVKSIMQPSYIEMRNSEKKTAQELFTSQHVSLLKDAKEWINDTARSCMVVSSLLVSGLFTSVITVTLGGKDSTAQNHLKDPVYQTFIISAAVALFLDYYATLMFFYILTSRYEERDFLHDLPSKLINGLMTLFISILSLTVTFILVFFIAYGYKNIVPYVICGCAFVPVYICFDVFYPFLKEIRTSVKFRVFS